MIGDANADLEAARINKIDFVLREHIYNHIPFCQIKELNIK